MARRFCTLLCCVSQTEIYCFHNAHLLLSHHHTSVMSCVLPHCSTTSAAPLNVCCSASGTAFTDKERKEKG